MKQTTAAFAAKMNDTLRTYIPRMTINGVEIDGDIEAGLIINLGSCGTENFAIGTLYVPYITASIRECTTKLQDMEIFLEMGMVLDDGAVEYVPVGYFTVEKPATDKYRTSFTAYGRLMSKCGGLYVSNLTYPAEIADVLSEISAATGISITLRNLEYDGTIEKPMVGLLYREALQITSGLLGGFCTEDSAGNIVISKFELTDSVTIDTDICYEWPESNDNLYEVTGLEVVVSEDGQDDEGNIIPGTKFSSDTTANVIVKNEYMTENLFKTCEANVVGFSYLPSKVEFLGDIRLEPWDNIVVTDDDTSVKVPCMNITHTWDGGLVTTITAPGATETEDSSSFGGPLTTLVERTYADLMVAKQIIASKITAEEADIKYANLAEFTSLKGYVENLSAKSITTENLSSEVAKLGYATITELNAANAEISTLKTKAITTDNLSAEVAKLGYATVENLNAATADITQLKSDVVAIEKAYITEADVETLVAAKGYITKLETNTLLSGYVKTETLTADYITTAEISAKYATITSLEAKEADIKSIFADYVKTETLTADYIKAADIAAKYATITSLNATTAEITNLKSIAITTTNLSAKVAELGYAKVTELEAVEGKIDDLTAIAITTDNLSAKVGEFGYITAKDVAANYATITSLNATNGNITSLQSKVATIEEAYMDEAEVNTLVVGKGYLTEAEVNTLIVDKGYFTEADVETLVVGKGYITSAKVNELLTDYATIENLETEKARITDLESTRVKTSELESKIATFGYLKTTTAQATYATITNLNATNANVEALQTDVANIEKAYISTAEVNTLLSDYVKTDDLEADVAEFGYLKATTAQATYATITNLNAVDAKFDTLSSTYATIDLVNVKDGSITTAMIGTGVVGTAQIADGSITDAKIVGLTANKITAGKLDAAEIEVVNLNAANITVGTINGQQIANGVIDASKLTDALNTTINTAASTASSAQTAAENAQTTADGKNTVFYQASAPSTTGRKTNDVWFDTDDGNKMYYFNGSAWTAKQFSTSAIAASSITSNLIAAGAITAAKIASNTITANEIAAGAVSTSELAASAVTTAKIAAGAITATTIAADAVTTEKIATGAVVADSIAAGAITSDKVVAGAITAAKIASNTITANEIAANTITASQIAAATITGTEIKANTINAGHLSVDTLSAISANLGTVTAGILMSENYQESDYAVDSNGNATGEVLSGLKIDLNNKAYYTPQITIKDNFILLNGFMTIGDRADGEAGALSFTVGRSNKASEAYGVALGYGSEAGAFSFAQGLVALATGTNAVCLGYASRATGFAAFATGQQAYADGRCAHAEGHYNYATGENSHAEGYGNNAASDNQHVQGTCNVKDSTGKYAHIVGNGKLNSPSNAHTLDWSGNAWYAGDVIAGGTQATDGTITGGVSLKKNSIYYIEGTGSTAGTWLGTCDAITEYFDGLTIAYKVGIAGVSGGTTLNINDLGAIAVMRNASSAVTTHYGVNSVIILVYTTDDGTGYWKVADYDANNYAYVRQYYTTASNNYPLLTKYDAGITTTTNYVTKYSRYSNKFYINPSTGTLTAPTFVGALTGNADTATTLTGLTATVAELNYCDGVTSNIQTQLNGKAATHSHPYLSNTLHCIELNSTGSLSNYGGFIDFHFNGSTADYTSRIIENASGTLSINGVTVTSGKVVTATTFVGALTGNATSATTATTCTGNAATATKATNDKNGKDITRVYSALIPMGTAIPSNADLNTTTYIKVGNYSCTSNATSGTLTNCPIAGTAFMMQVYAPLASTLDDETTSTYRYRIRKIIKYNTGEEYIQFVSSGATAGTFTYGSWRKVLHQPTVGTAIGSSTKPIYINSSGVPTACGNSLAVSITGNAATATRATQDGNGNVIASTYLPLTGGTLTGDLTVGSASLGTNGYVTGTWLRTTGSIALSSAASLFAVVSGGWIYTRTAAQALSDIGAAAASHTHSYLPLSGGNVSGHVYLTGAKASSSTGNTSQIIFGTSSDNHVAISSNNNALVINPTSSSTTNQIVLYLDKASVFPNGISGNASSATKATQDGDGNVISSTYSKTGHTHSGIMNNDGYEAKILITYGTKGSTYYLRGNGSNDGFTYYLGTSTNRWATIYAVNALNTSSDLRFKIDLSSDMSKYIEMMDLIEPITFRRTNTKEIVRHAGYGAQHVEQALYRVGLTDNDFAGLAKEYDEETGQYTYGLAYEEFIPILHAKVNKVEKEHLARIASLEARMRWQENLINQLINELANCKQQISTLTAA